MAGEDDDAVVNLSWTAPDHSDLTGYRIWRGTDADTLAVLVEDTGNTATTYRDSAVSAGQSYSYAVAAHSLDGTGPRSGDAGLDIPTPQPTPTPAPTPNRVPWVK